jgi:hypothetical protein
MRDSFTVFNLIALTLLLASPMTRAAAPPSDPAQRGLEIAQTADRAGQGFGAEHATLAMDLVNAYGDVTKRKLTVDTLEGRDDGDKSKVVGGREGDEAAHVEPPQPR